MKKVINVAKKAPTPEEMSSNPQTFEFDPADKEGHIKLMEQYAGIGFPFFGQNENGDTVMIDIYGDRIKVTTYQSNHWIRVNVYWDDGTVEESYDGKWED